jgi:hypothetical protein
MAIPRETSKELIVTVENEALTVAITPAILDGVIVQGVAPEQNPDTILFSNYDPIAGNIFVRTVDGQEFYLSTSSVALQVSVGTGNPTAPGTAGALYIDKANNSIWEWTE